jgi:cyanate permease
MFITGVVWLAADWQKSSPQGDIWQAIASWLLMLHGGGAMASLLFIGALVPLHMHRGWRAKRNRISGAVMVLENAVLIATSFGLYYVGSDVIRPWMSDIHIGAGFCLPLLLVLHILLGRRTARQRAQNSLQ